MNSRYQTDDDLQDLHDSRGQDREISLGAATILGIFLVLALLCAVFFGFGYSLGRRSAPPVISAAESTTSSESSTSKPAPGSPATHTASSAAAIQSDDASQSLSDVPTTASTEPSQPAPGITRVKAVAADFRPDTRTESAVKPITKPASIAPIAPAAPGVAIVQVAAVSHQEDADVLVNALKHRGYNVAIRKEPQDKLLHVQIGPFATKKDADAMRQRLQTDGYNAIVK